MRDARYDVLFEPVKIGPVTARNRFYQVPHCNGLGHVYPKAEAAMRATKAEGGWAVVSTQEVEIHPSSDVSPYIEGRLWDDHDMRRMQLVVDAIHQHGSLAAIEITHNGHAASNLHSRIPPMAVTNLAMVGDHPQQPHIADKKDLANIRRWHKKAALRAKQIGFDIIYVYAGHSLALPFHFISPKHNTRCDEYGGSLENRCRLSRELLEETKESVGDSCGIAFRFAVDELMGDTGLVSETEGKEVVEMLADYPDIWDVNISDWANDSATSRFSAEGFQEKYTAFVKQVTQKPVVGVGRFTSPDTMVSQIKRGVLDMIGAARPSIADPFLPRKIEQGDIESIRECIGCNICVASDNIVAPIRCTQNPTIGEEYRKDWHPEIITKKHDDQSILIVGAGPSGLEAAMSLARRGYQVHIAEQQAQPGGRVLKESTLPGMSAYKRVIDYRLGQIEKMNNVNLYLNSKMTAEDIIEFSRQYNSHHIVIASGAKWVDNGQGRQHLRALENDCSIDTLTPDDVMNGCPLHGRIVIYDDDHYYMGSVIADKATPTADSVTLITPAANIASWTENTLEQTRIEQHLHQLGVHFLEKKQIKAIAKKQILLSHIHYDTSEKISADKVVLITARQPSDDIYHQLQQRFKQNSHPLQSLIRIGDCLAPATIATAVYSGHEYAQNFDKKINIDQVPYKREYTEI